MQEDETESTGGEWGKPKIHMGPDSFAIECFPPRTREKVDLEEVVGTDPVPVERWRELSREGKVCAIVPCDGAPSWKCPKADCGVHYCRDHTGHHFHLGGTP